MLSRSGIVDRFAGSMVYLWWVGVRAVVVLVLGTVLLLGGAFGWASQPAASETPLLPVPTFAAQPPTLDPSAARVARRPTLLPTDCANLLSGPVDASALLAQPVGSLGAHAVVGVNSPSVGLLERLTCNYRRADRGAPILVLGLAAFTDPAAAARQRERNIAAERGDTRAARNVPLGDASSTLLTQPAHYLLMVAYDRYTVTLRLARGIVPDDQVEQVLVDAARRVWPEVAPALPPTHPQPSRR